MTKDAQAAFRDMDRFSLANLQDDDWDRLWW